MDLIDTLQRLKVKGWGRSIAGIAVLLCMAGAGLFMAHAETDNNGQGIDVDIIVLPNLDEARSVLTELEGGADFGVVAKEKSIDASAVNGGYLGKMTLDELRPELKDALQGRKAGEPTGVIHLPSGFAIAEVLTAAPATADLDPNRITEMIASGAIHYGPAVSGLLDANSAFRDYVREKGWDESPEGACEVRKKSLAGAKQILQGYLAPESVDARHLSLTDQVQGHSVLAGLYAYSGEMEKAISEWKAAYALAEKGDPDVVPTLEEGLGASYLHDAEMKNGIYRDSGDMDIFPPLHPTASYAEKDDSKLAIENFKKYLEKRPHDLEVKWLLNLAYMTLGEYPSGVPAAYRIPESDFRSGESVGRFHDVAPAAGLNVFRSAGGAIVDDFDNDGLLDVVVSSQDVCDPIRFFHNNGDGTFTDRTKEAGLLGVLGGLNIVEGDYNNDGCMDILVLRGGWEFPQRKSLLRNNCDGTFTDVTDASGLGGAPTATQSAVWADIDNDGYLDLFVANEHSPAQLFHNKGDGTFEEIGHAAGIDQTAFSKGVTEADYDGDGLMDFYVSNQNGANFLYHNSGNLTFTEVGREAGVQAPAYSFATWFFDYDNDGWPDLFVTSYMPSVEESLKTYTGGKHNEETMKLYRNKHDGTFEDVTAKVGLDKVFMPMGANFGDFDNDGYLDIYLGVGQPSFIALMPHVLLKNDAGETFVDVTASSGTGDLHKGHGIAFADLTRRGSADIVAQMGGAVPADKHTLRVFENPGNKNDWLDVRLVGVKSNREAVGARIEVSVQNGSSPRRSIYRTVGQTSSFGGNPAEQLIGLGADAHDVTVDVRWPASRTQQHFAGVAKDGYIEIKEFAKEYSVLKHKPFRLGNAAGAVAAGGH